MSYIDSVYQQQLQLEIVDILSYRQLTMDEVKKAIDSGLVYWLSSHIEGNHVKDTVGTAFDDTQYVPVCVSKIDTTKAVRKMFSIVESYCDKNGYCNRSVGRLSKYLGMSSRSVQRHLNKLVETGWLYSIEVTKQPTIYLLEPITVWDSVRLAFYLYKHPSRKQCLQIALYGDDLQVFKKKDYLENPTLVQFPEEEIPY